MKELIFQTLPKFKLTRFILTIILIPVRFKIGFHYLKRPMVYFSRWIFASREITNFTYDLTTMNKKYLASSLSVVSNKPIEKLLEYIKEIDANEELKRFIRKKIKSSFYNFQADQQIYFCRRIGWYVLIRALKPKIVVETGVDKGLGSVIIAEALRKNYLEGYKGWYYGIDNVLSAGYLFDAPYNKFGKILYGDSIKSLKKLSESIDIFINDSDHSANYEAREYEIIRSKLSKDAVLIGDNSHVTDRLYEFSQRTGRQFIFWSEKPKKHWYPGAGMGIAFRKNDKNK